jgi:hypothetical protein
MASWLKAALPHPLPLQAHPPALQAPAPAQAPHQAHLQAAPHQAHHPALQALLQALRNLDKIGGTLHHQPGEKQLLHLGTHQIQLGTVALLGHLLLLLQHGTSVLQLQLGRINQPNNGAQITGVLPQTHGEILTLPQALGRIQMHGMTLLTGVLLPLTPGKTKEEPKLEAAAHPHHHPQAHHQAHQAAHLPPQAAAHQAVHLQAHLQAPAQVHPALAQRNEISTWEKSDR